MIINRILKMPLLKLGDKLMERNGKLVTLDLDIGTVQPRHLRLRMTPGTVLPHFQDSVGEWTQICTDPNIWDLYVLWGTSQSWADLFERAREVKDEIIGVIDGDCTGVTDMYRLFYNCPNIRSVGPLYNTGSVINGMGMFYCENGSGSIVKVTPFDTSGMAQFQGMFYGQANLKEIPLLDTSQPSAVSYMYYGCVNVERGILAAYNEMTSHEYVGNHYKTFYNCGINTPTGRAELAQIPSDWK